MNTRKQKIILSLAATSAALTVLPAFAARHTVEPVAAPLNETSGTWSFHRENVLGTSLDMTVKASSAGTARRAQQAALAEFSRQSRILSAWDPQSEFSHWQRTDGVAVPVSPELMDVLARFEAWHGMSGGILNASSETAAELWRGPSARGSAPTETELAIAIQRMNQLHWRLDRNAGTATRLSNAPLVLASFTKSLIASHAADAALAKGATGIMLNVGGDIVARGSLTQQIDIADPRASAENDAPIDTVALRDRAIATSGGYRRGFNIAGEHHSHLIDPRTATPARGVLSSSVIAGDAATAGALASALSILTPRESAALMRQHPEAQYLLLTRTGERIASDGWALYQEPRLQPAAYRVHAGSAPPTPASATFNPSMELLIKLDLPRIDDPRYRRPYVAVWIEDKDKYPVRTVALWFQKPRYLHDMTAWYRDDQVRNLSEGTDISTTVSSATRAPGSYTLRWDGKDNAGKLVASGKYTVIVEAAREHGGHSVERQEIDFNGTAAQFALPASEELGAVQLDYRKH